MPGTASSGDHGHLGRPGERGGSSSSSGTVTLYHVTPIRNLKKILANGLEPQIGKRSREIGETAPATYYFPNKDALEDALDGWLGLQFSENARLALLKVTLPESDVDTSWNTTIGTAGYERVTRSTVPPSRIEVVSRDIMGEEQSFFKALKEAVDKKNTAVALRSEQTANIAKLLRGVHGRHIARLEGAILRYQADITDAVNEHLTPVKFKARMAALASQYVTNAVTFGYTRALIDLRNRNWITRIEGDVTPSKAIVDAVLDENLSYLAGFKEDIPSMSQAAIRARAQQYGHVLWPASERGYKQCLKDFVTFYSSKTTQKVRETADASIINPNEVTRTATKWMPASKVAALPGMMSEHSQKLVDETRVTSMAAKMKAAGGYDASKIPRIKLTKKDDGALCINDGNHRARGAAKAFGDKLIPVEVEYYGRAGKLQEGGAGSGDHGHAGRIGVRGGSAPGTHIAKITDDDAMHDYSWVEHPGVALHVHGYPTDTRLRNAVLREIDRNIELIPGQVKQVDEVFLTDHMTQESYGKVEDMGTTDGITLNYYPTNDARKVVVGFNTKQIALHTSDNYSIGSDAKSATGYAKAVVDHEMGHVYYSTLPDDVKRSFVPIWREASPAISKYAITSPVEGFAEAYSAYVNKLPLPASMTHFFEDHIGKHYLKEASASSTAPLAYLCGFGRNPTYHVYADHVEKIAAYSKLAEAGPEDVPGYIHVEL